MPRAIYTLFEKVPNTYVVLVGMLAIVLAATMVGFYVVGQTTPNVIRSDYGAIAATRKMKHAIAGLRHPEDYPTEKTEYYIRQFNEGLAAAKSDSDTPGEVESIAQVDKIWSELEKDPSHITIPQFWKISGPLDQFITLNENEMVNRMTKQERIRMVVSWCGIPFFLLAWFV